MRLVFIPFGQKQRNQKFTALSNDFQTWMEKFKIVSQEIANKQKTYMEVVQQRMSQQSADMEANFAGAGPNQQQQLLDQQTIRIQAETDFNSRVIEERQQVFNQAESLMNDIN